MGDRPTKSERGDRNQEREGGPQARREGRLRNLKGEGGRRATPHPEPTGEGRRRKHPGGKGEGPKNEEGRGGGGQPRRKKTLPNQEGSGRLPNKGGRIGARERGHPSTTKGEGGREGGGGEPNQDVGPAPTKV